MKPNPNSQLKDFQLATVDFVFSRLMDAEDPCNRFLIADEVGLGKTLVARGIIQRFYDSFKAAGKKQLNVIYICSNQSIASQNISRLNFEKQKGASPPIINRINDLAVTNPNQAVKAFLQITALSPNTSFRISTGGGTVKERAILYHILCKHSDFTAHKPKLKRIFCLDVSESSWEREAGPYSPIRASLQANIVTTFNDLLHPQNEYYAALLTACEERFSSSDYSRHRRLIGGLRKTLASVCVAYLKPDLIIMDEFQRFKYLIDSQEENEVKLITDSLFSNDEIKILLLSATPYKMYQIQSEDDGTESHFEGFKFIVDFLLKDERKRKQFEQAWGEYSKALLHLNEGNRELIKAEKRKVETLLRSVIARTERITVSDDKNTMLHSSESNILWIQPEDIQNFMAADAIAAQLKDVQSPIEYCKSSPFPFSFMEGYQLQKITQHEIRNGNNEIKELLHKSRNSFLPVTAMEGYGAIENQNAKLTYLLNDALYNGGSDLLWIPPSYPYYEPAGAYKDKEHFSKTLVFSSWIMVPKMIAALSSYECERLTIGYDSTSKAIYFDSNTHKRNRLRLNAEFTSLSSYALLYPSLTLSALWKPLEQFQPLDKLIAEVSLNVQNLLKGFSPAEFITEPKKQDDDRWALVYMLLLDRKYKWEQVTHLSETADDFDWDWFDRDSEASVASDYYNKVFRDILFAERPKQLSAWQLRNGERPENSIRETLQGLKLGQPPVDIVQQLTLLTIASPAICSHRLLNTYTKQDREIAHIPFFGAFRIADSFRKFFNLPENVAVVDKYAISDKSYWENVLRYCASGSVQSMLDEFANVMIDHNGIWDSSTADTVDQLIRLISDNIGLRTVSVAGHTYKSFIKEDEHKPKYFRCHFGVTLNQSLVDEKDVLRGDSVRNAFNSPFRPFVLATTSIGQEGLDFHLYCRKILHWNLPANPVDFEQREGRINRFKNLAIRQNLAKKYRDSVGRVNSATLWNQLYQLAIRFEKGTKSDLVPYWHVEPEHIFIERQVPVIPYSKEVRKLKNLLKTISVYRIALGQPRQEELVKYLIENFDEAEIEKVQSELLINLSPFKRD